jgi:hypothetical protein
MLTVVGEEAIAITREEVVAIAGEEVVTGDGVHLWGEGGEVEDEET